MVRDRSSDPDADDDWSLPDCPRCGEPVAMSVVTGPDSGTLKPCGCSVPPAVLVGLE